MLQRWCSYPQPSFPSREKPYVVLTVHTFLLSRHICPCVGAMGSLAVKGGGKKKILPTFPSWQSHRALLRRFSHCQQDPERRKQCLCRVPAQRVTQSQHGREAAKHGNGEFQVNVLCFHVNSWFALKSLKNNSLKNSGGTRGNYQVTHLFIFP